MSPAATVEGADVGITGPFGREVCIGFSTFTPLVFEGQAGLAVGVGWFETAFVFGDGDCWGFAVFVGLFGWMEPAVGKVFGHLPLPLSILV